MKILTDVSAACLIKIVKQLQVIKAPLALIKTCKFLAEKKEHTQKLVCFLKLETFVIWEAVIGK